MQRILKHFLLVGIWDSTVPLAAVRQNCEALKFANEEFLKDDDFIKNALTLILANPSKRKQLFPEQQPPLISLSSIDPEEPDFLARKISYRFNFNCSSSNTDDKTIATAGLVRLTKKPIAALILNSDFAIVLGDVDFGSVALGAKYLDPRQEGIVIINQRKEGAIFALRRKTARLRCADDIKIYQDMLHAEEDLKEKVRNILIKICGVNDKKLDQKTTELLKVLIYCKELPEGDYLFDKKSVCGRIFDLKNITQQEYTRIKSKLSALESEANQVRNNISEIRSENELPPLRECRIDENIFVEEYNEIHVPAALAMIEGFATITSDNNFYQVYLMHKKLKTVREVVAKACADHESSHESSELLTEEQKEAIKMFCVKKPSTYKEFFDQVVKEEINFFKACQKNYQSIAESLYESEPITAMRARLQAERFAKLTETTKTTTTTEEIETFADKFEKELPMQVYDSSCKMMMNGSDYLGIDPEILCRVFEQKELTKEDLTAISNLIKKEPEKASNFLQQQHNNEKCEDFIFKFLNSKKNGGNLQYLSSCITSYLEEEIKPSKKCFLLSCLGLAGKDSGVGIG